PLLGCAGPVRTEDGRAPGSLPSHYAPNARVVVVEQDALADAVREELASGAGVGVLAAKLPDGLPEAAVVLGVPVDAEEYARTLYACLRDADRRALDVVLAVAPAELGVGAAVADRLRRAAHRRRAG